MLIGIFYSHVVESSSFFFRTFSKAISHPYSSFFHLIVNGFSVIHISLAPPQLLLNRDKGLILSTLIIKTIQNGIFQGKKKSLMHYHTHNKQQKNKRKSMKESFKVWLKL